MSSRALRRLEKQREQQNLESGLKQAGETVYNEPKKAQNLFALIGDDENDEESEDDIGQDVDDDKEQLVVVEPLKIQLQSKSQKKKKKKAKGKKKSKSEEPEDVNETNGDDAEEDKKGDEEFNKLLKEYGVDTDAPIDTTAAFDNDEDDNELELNITHLELDPSFRYFTPKKQVKYAKLLSVDPKDLDPDNEFKRLFGKLSQEAIEDADSTTSTSIPPDQLAQIRKLTRVVRGWGGRDRRSIPGTTRKLILTKIRDDWIPTPKKDIFMEELSLRELVEDRSAESEDWIDVIKDDITTCLNYGIKYYKFDRNAESKLINSQFYSSVVLTPNHENLIQLLPKFPYHVETILQVALIFIRQGDKSNSNGLIERALFAFDRGFKQNFDLSNGITRLPFNYYLNRQFYLAIFRYIEVLTKKGTFATALAYSKILLALSPSDDPLGVRYFIDFYAILAHDYNWLIGFVESPIVQTYIHWFTPGLAYSVVLAYYEVGQVSKAKSALQKAFTKHPYVGYKLLDLIGLASDIPVHDYSIYEVSPEAEIITETYLVRASVMWKESKHRQFLHDSSIEILSKKPAFESRGNSPIISENLLRFVILSGEGKVMAKIPSEIWENNQIFEYDILPPKVGNVETLEDFIDSKYISSVADEERMMEMVRNMSLQDLIDRGVQIDADEHENLQRAARAD